VPAEWQLQSRPSQLKRLQFATINGVVICPSDLRATDVSYGFSVMCPISILVILDRTLRHNARNDANPFWTELHGDSGARQPGLAVLSS